VRLQVESDKVKEKNLERTLRPILPRETRAAASPTLKAESLKNTIRIRTFTFVL
jgi:hypothetical protein